MKKSFTIVIISILVSSITSCKHRNAYENSECAYCGASKHVEGGVTTSYPPSFPSENPPEHTHLFIPVSGYGGGSHGIFWDGTSDSLEVLWQLKKLNKNGQLSEDVIKEWFSINVGNPEVLKTFAEKHNLKIREHD